MAKTAKDVQETTQDIANESTIFHPCRILGFVKDKDTKLPKIKTYVKESTGETKQMYSVYILVNNIQTFAWIFEEQKELFEDFGRAIIYSCAQSSYVDAETGDNFNGYTISGIWVEKVRVTNSDLIPNADSAPVEPVS